MGVEYKLPLALQDNLESLGLSEEEIKANIEKHAQGSRVYFDAMLGGIKLTEDQVKLLRECYIQYKLFADVGMDESRESQRLFMNSFINGLKKNADLAKAESKAQNSVKRMRVL